MLSMHQKIPSNIIETSRLLLKEVDPDVMKQLFNDCTDDEIIQFLGLGSNDELIKEKHKFSLGLTMHNTTFLHLLLLDKQSGCVIGRCGFRIWQKQHSRAEVGYAITNAALRNKGYMREALTALVDLGFSQLGLNRIEAFIGTNNIPSLKLVIGLGFTQEGILRQHYCHNGIIEDSVCFSLLRQEYTQRVPEKSGL